MIFKQSKGQLISKTNCQAEDSSIKQTNKFVLEESSARKRRFEINWPLGRGQLHKKSRISFLDKTFMCKKKGSDRYLDCNHALSWYLVDAKSARTKYSSMYYIICIYIPT